MGKKLDVQEINALILQQKTGPSPCAIGVLA
jgi:hypothetical protein